MSLQGAWLTEYGLTDRMPLKIQVMPGCMVITAQNTRELWCKYPGKPNHSLLEIFRHTDYVP
ncbi:SymE family type I addiction module toxin [Dickeya zeae]|uniref:SymE family type I addiction module toxin n=1 Tax=Dickeya zeae TaxID=204042 RepID=UPI003DA03499